MRTFGLLAWLMVPVLVGPIITGLARKSFGSMTSRGCWPRPIGWPPRSSGRRPRHGTSRPWRSCPRAVLDETRRVRLQRAKVQMLDHQLPEANAALRELADQLEADKSADPRLRDEARSTLANSQYYLTWLMRLEGLGAQEWEPEIESARQTYRLLAEEADGAAIQTPPRSIGKTWRAPSGFHVWNSAQLQGLDLPKQ